MGASFYGPLARLYDEVVVDPAFPRWADFLIRRWSTDDVPVASVLDVGCGTGLLMAELADRGCRVVGLDGSPAMLERARDRLGPRTTLVESVLPEVPDLGLFDAAVSTFDTLNYLDPAAFAATMPAVAGRLRTGGWWVFDLHTDALLRLVEEQPRSEGAEAGWAFTLVSTVDRSARTCTTRFDAVLEATGEQVAEVHLQFFPTDDQVHGALTAAGFEHIERVDEYTDQPCTSETLRATWISRRGR
jgi:SAM-dependent methyltransferase